MFRRVCYALLGVPIRLQTTRKNIIFLNTDLHALEEHQDAQPLQVSNNFGQTF